MPRCPVLVGLAFLAGCAPVSAVNETAIGSRPAAPDTTALARDLPRLLEISGIPGLSMAVVQKGRVTWDRAFGTVNDSAQRPLVPDAVFEAASLSKPVFAYLVLRLVDRGEFDLDRPLHEMLEYPRLAHDERYQRITARMVLSHATGLPNWGGERLDLSFDPGTSYGYSGDGFVFLQKVLERVTGDSLARLARREVFQPLGMKHSSYVWQDRFAGHEAYARDWLWNVAPVNHYAEGNAAASLLTTAGDYARFVAAVLTGRGLSPKMWQQYLTPARATSPGISIALGIRVEEGPAGRIFYHSGNNGRRFTCYMTGDVARGLGMVYFTGASDGTTLVQPLALHVFGRDHPAQNWSTFDRYDDPRRLAIKSVERAAVERGADAAREHLLQLNAAPATHLTLDETLDLGAFFAGRGLGPLSIEVLRQAEAEAPDSAEVHLALGRALESSGNIPAALESYRRAQTLDAGRSDARELIRWAEQRLAARARRTAISAETLVKYAGRYQDRMVSFRESRLFYTGGVQHPESSLTPIRVDVFEVDADPTIRIQFDAGATKLVARYRDGTFDEWVRSAVSP